MKDKLNEGQMQVWTNRFGYCLIQREINLTKVQQPMRRTNKTETKQPLLLRHETIRLCDWFGLCRVY